MLFICEIHFAGASIMVCRRIYVQVPMTRLNHELMRLIGDINWASKVKPMVLNAFASAIVSQSEGKRTSRCDDHMSS